MDKCSRWKNEQQILDLVDQEKVTFQKARQLLQNNPEEPNKKYKAMFPTHFNVKLAIEYKRKISTTSSSRKVHPKTTLAQNLEPYRTKDATTFIIEISSHKESVAMTISDKVVQTTIWVTGFQPCWNR